MAQLIRVLAEPGDLEQIAKRVLILKFLLSADEEKRQRDLAERLGVSKQRASAAVDFLRGKLSEITSGSESGG